MKFTAQEMAVLRKKILNDGKQEVSEQEIIDAYNAGESINKIAYRLRLNEPLVRSILTKNCVEIRDRRAAGLSWRRKAH